MLGCVILTFRQQYADLRLLSWVIIYHSKHYAAFRQRAVAPIPFLFINLSVFCLWRGESFVSRAVFLWVSWTRNEPPRWRPEKVEPSITAAQSHVRSLQHHPPSLSLLLPLLLTSVVCLPPCSHWKKWRQWWQQLAVWEHLYVCISFYQSDTTVAR